MVLLTAFSWSPASAQPFFAVSTVLRAASGPASGLCVISLRQPTLRLQRHLSRRLGTSTPKCFATNIDIDCENDVVEDSSAENPRSFSSGSLVSVHLKSDILGANPLDLSGKEADANNLFTKLHVLSKVEQDALAATPTHPTGLYALYAISLVGNLVERLWNFVWPAAVATIYPNLLPVAVLEFFTKLTVFVGGPVVGTLLDYFPRVPVYHCLNFVQTAAQLLSAGMIIYALSTVKHSSASSVLLQPWFIILVVAAASERLAGLALGVTMERDWVVLLAGRNRPVALAQANSILGRADLFCEIAGASLFGILLSKYNSVTCLKLACGMTVFVQPVLFVLGQLINSLSNGVLDLSRSPNMKPVVTPLFDASEIVGTGLDAFRQGWKEYKHQPVLPASLAYVLLYFNVALAPGSIMTTLLVHHGNKSSQWINPALFSGDLSSLFCHIFFKFNLVHTFFIWSVVCKCITIHTYILKLL